MFARLFSQSGLSLDRLRALVEVGAHGSIVRAAEGGVARQSQFSRQLKELEDFFQVALVERHGRSVRLTPRGRELARISRFFLLGMSNFQRGCLAEAQTYRIAASATFAQTFLVPALSALNHRKGGVRFGVETADSGEIERRLHELTLDFGVVDKPSLSRPLQVQELGRSRLKLWIPKALRLDARQARRAFQARKLPLAWPAKELPLSRFETLTDLEPALTCETFLEARAALLQQDMATVLPGFLEADVASSAIATHVASLDSVAFGYGLAWNPRMLRLNPHARKERDTLIAALAQHFKGR